MEDNTKVIKEIKKNTKQIVRICLSEYKNNTFLDLRIYLLQEDGSYVPSKKGIALNKNVLPEVIEGLMSGLEQL